MKEGHYSQAMLKALLDDRYKARIATNLLGMIRQVADAKIIMGLTPIPACTDDELSGIEAAESNFQDDEASLELANEHFFGPMNAELMGQPRSTLTIDGLHTLPHFTKNSKRLSIGDIHDDQIHPETERFHMNEEFGSLWLHDFFDKVL